MVITGSVILSCLNWQVFFWCFPLSLLLCVLVQIRWFNIHLVIFLSWLQRRAYVLAALVLGGIYFLCCVVLFLGVKEQLGEHGFLGASVVCRFILKNWLGYERHQAIYWWFVSLSTPAPLSTLDRIRMPYLAGMKMVVGHTPYVKLVFGFLFASLAFQVRVALGSGLCVLCVWWWWWWSWRC